jgi:hypothetical protein
MSGALSSRSSGRAHRGGGRLASFLTLLRWPLVPSALTAMLLLTRLAIAVADSPCREEREFSAAEYWMWQGYLGVTQERDGDGTRSGRLASDPGSCFHVNLGALKDPLERTRGYKRAVAEWLKVLLHGGADAESARRGIKALTGQPVLAADDFKAWWIENNDYLRWSDRSQRLEIDTTAKAARLPIVPLQPTQVISAERYWYYEGMGWLRGLHRTDGTLEGKAWTGETEIKVRVPSTAIGDRKAKEQGYRHAVQTMIEDRLRLSEFGERAAATLMTRLREVTSENFDDRQAWIAWWNRTKDSLALSPDGQRLIVRSE